MILDEIIENKKIEITESKKIISLENLEGRIKTIPDPRNFYESLCPGENGIKIIAEIKKASPSKGLLTQNFDPAGLAKTYSAYGASAISVLTDNKYFKGSLNDLSLVRNTVDLPLLRKDFIIDPYQVYEARYHGADAVLLIVAALENEQLSDLKEIIESLGMYALVEVHDEMELERALDLNSSIIGINNRDLKTFDVDLNTAVKLCQLIPEDKLVISESGISSSDDILFLYKHGIKSFLIGEILVKSENISKLMHSFLNFNN